MANLFTAVLFLSGVLSIVAFIINPSYWINLYTGLLFWAVALFNAALEFWQSYSSAKTLEGFLGLVPSTCLAVRDGHMCQMAPVSLVVGDIVILRTGNKIPADVRIIWSDNARVDNSSLTGESEPQERSAAPCQALTLEATNLLFSGTILISGEVTAVVIRIGMHTVIGRLAEYAVTAPKRTSPLEAEMIAVIRRLVLAAFFFAITALTLGFSLGLYIDDIFDATIGIFVAFLPQGLPATMTILLTSAAKRMAKRNVLVKELRSVETLGSITLLATDKTGTLTQNKMSLVGGWIFTRLYNDVEELTRASREIEPLVRLVALCTNSKYDQVRGDSSTGDRVIYGDATEVGILHFADRTIGLEKVFKGASRLLEMPFNSTTKWHLTIYEGVEADTFTVIIKGAPERVLQKCTSYRGTDGKELLLDGDFGSDFRRKYEYFAGSGLRVIAVATASLGQAAGFPAGSSFERDPPNFPMDNFTFWGLICLRDPPKPGVAWAVSRLKDAGIQVVMVTGDHPLTAEAIARQIGIVTSGEVFRRPPTASDVMNRPLVDAAIIHGETLDSMTASDWRRLCALKQIVFARTAPRQKLEIVCQFQNFGHVVAVSGDGVNDSPALRKANLGISMNETASDVSKDAAHMILLDDNFVSIVAGVFEGRLIFENLKKSIRYTLTHITSEVSAMLLFTLLLIPPPLSPILLIFIDVFSELGPAVAFAGEPPEYDLMKVGPRQRVQKTPPKARAVGSALRQWVRLPAPLARAVMRVGKVFYFHSSGEKLVDADLVLWSFLQGGIIIALGAWGAWVIVLAVEHFPLGRLYRSYPTYFTSTSPAILLTNDTFATASDQVVILGRVQAAYYLAVVLAQFLFNSFAQKHRYRLPYGRDMFVNGLTYVGILTASLVAAIVAYIPALNAIFATDVPPALSLAPPAAAGVFLICYEFLRRHLKSRGLFGGIPNKAVMVRPPPAGAIVAPPAVHGSELAIAGARLSV